MDGEVSAAVREYWRKFPLTFSALLREKPHLARAFWSLLPGSTRPVTVHDLAKDRPTWP